MWDGYWWGIGPREEGSSQPQQQLLLPTLDPAVSLLPSPWLFCLAVVHAKAIVVILDSEKVESFGSWCFRPYKLQDVVGTACLGSNYCVQFPASPTHYFHLLFNSVEFVGPRGVKVHTHDVT